jgi:hypothetical protein
LKFSKIVAIGAVAVATVAAQAKPVSLTGSSDPVNGGSFAFEGTKDTSFYVVLDAGTYSFESSVTASGEKLAAVWLSFSQNKNDDGKDDIVAFSGNAAQNEFGGTYSPLVLTKATKVFLDVNTILGKNAKNGSFDGTLTVTSSVPEPATAALLLAGLGMMGFVGRRRRNNG